MLTIELLMQVLPVVLNGLQVLAVIVDIVHLDVVLSEESQHHTRSIPWALQTLEACERSGEWST